MFKPQNKYPGIFDFNGPQGMNLKLSNRWVAYSKVIPWDRLEVLYSELFKDKKTGNVAKNFRLMMGACIIQRVRGLSDREVVIQIEETPCLQYFCGMPDYREQRLFHASTLTYFRKRLTPELVIAMNDISVEFLNVLQEDMLASKPKLKKEPSPRIAKQKGKKPKLETIQDALFIENEDDSDLTSDGDSPETDLATNPVFYVPIAVSEEPKTDEVLPPNQGNLLIDSTCVPQNIRFPQDISLLNEVREKTEQLIDKLHDIKICKKPKTYRIRARKDYLAVVRKKKKTGKEIRAGLRKQLNYIKRNFGIIDFYLKYYRSRKQELSEHNKALLTVLTTVYEQQLSMYQKRSKKIENRVVSVSQPYIRPIVRGKARTNCEFGAKIDISATGGFARLEHVSFDAYNESVNFIKIVENYRKIYGYYPAKVLVDQIFRTRANLQFCKEKNISMSGKTLGRPKKDTVAQKKQIRQDEIERVAIERKIGYIKGSFGLKQLNTRLEHTSKVTIAIAVMASNVVYFVRVFCFYFLLALRWIKNMQILGAFTSIMKKMMYYGENCKIRQIN
jgi:hypothetical protein